MPLTIGWFLLSLAGAAGLGFLAGFYEGRRAEWSFALEESPWLRRLFERRGEEAR